MSQPQSAASAPAAPAAGPQKKALKKGDILFKEGEASRSMYLVKSGMIRLFKKKGETSFIELATVHAGSIIGELAFLDGQPRSATGEALTATEIIEIGGPTYEQVLSSTPEWLKILLKTVVGRLRDANTKIKQLESASTSIDYSDPHGKNQSQYAFLSINDVLRLLTSVLIGGLRGNVEHPKGGKVLQITALEKYSKNVMQVPLAKLAVFLDVMADCELIRNEQDEVGALRVLSDVDGLDELITTINEENLLEPSKRHDLTPRGFTVLAGLVKHLDRYPANPATQMAAVNIAEIKKLEAQAAGKDVFFHEDFPELVRVGYASAPQLKSADEITTQVKPSALKAAYRYQRMVIAVNRLNESKRQGLK
jgi:CRP-like cAMP-binding protein